MEASTEVLQEVERQVPGSARTISYNLPAFKKEKTFFYFAAFKKHVGFYPPVRGDTRLERAAAPYAGAKGNLRFTLDEPIPLALIERLTRHRVKQNLASAADKRGKRRA